MLRNDFEVFARITNESNYNMQIWIHTLLSVFVVSMVSLIGVATLSLKEEKLRKIVLSLVSFAAGTLLGDAFIHLMPEAFDSVGERASLLILFGLLLFFIFERFVHWRHCHEEHCEEHAEALPYMVLIGDGLHNFVDGMIIGASYLVSIPVGIATTIAVILHEIPQEIGDFSALIYGGFSKSKAIFWNFASALTAVAGAVIVLAASRRFESVTDLLIPIAAGGFIYIATADMSPEIHRHRVRKLSETFRQILFFISGVAIMYALLVLE